MLLFTTFLTVLLGTALCASIAHKEIEINHNGVLYKVAVDAEDLHSHDTVHNIGGLKDDSLETGHEHEVGKIGIHYKLQPHTEHLYDVDEDEQHHEVLVNIELGGENEAKGYHGSKHHTKHHLLDTLEDSDEDDLVKHDTNNFQEQLGLHNIHNSHEIKGQRDFPHQNLHHFEPSSHTIDYYGLVFSDPNTDFYNAKNHLLGHPSGNGLEDRSHYVIGSPLGNQHFVVPGQEHKAPLYHGLNLHGFHLNDIHHLGYGSHHVLGQKENIKHWPHSKGVKENMVDIASGTTNYLPIEWGSDVGGNQGYVSVQPAINGVAGIHPYDHGNYLH